MNKSSDNQQNSSQNRSPEQSGPEFWLSLDQLNNTPEFAARAEHEFLASPFANSGIGEAGFARRDFLKFMGASLAMATTACIRRPIQKIIPYAKAPKEVTPGEANYYASTWFDGNEGAGLLVKTLEGRPLKLEGNPHHPMNLGSLPARAHAEVLSLYDPDRLQGPQRNLQNKLRTNREPISTTWDEVDGKMLEQISKGQVAILSSTLPSPSTSALIGHFLKTFSGRHVQYDALPNDAVREAQRICYGRAVLPRYRFDEAKLVVSIDADFLGNYLSSAEFTKQWSKGRKPGASMNRLVMFEGNMTLTGMNADDRIRIKPSQQLDVVLGLAREVAKTGKVTPPTGSASILEKYDGMAQQIGVDPALFTKLAQELIANRGQSIVLAGGLPAQTSEAVELQIAVNLLNSMLGNDGSTIDHDQATMLTHAGSPTELSALIADMQAGKIKTLIIHDLNPGYVLPEQAHFSEALAKVEMVIYTGNRSDETGKLAHYILPTGSPLESWG